MSYALAGASGWWFSLPALPLCGYTILRINPPCVFRETPAMNRRQFLRAGAGRDREEWRPVFGYEGYYEVSSLGRIRSLHPGRRRRGGDILSLHGTPYLRVSLCRKGSKRTVNVHSLVARAFLGERPAGLEVNHRDGVSSNCAASNLEYVTSSENKLHTFRLGHKPVGSAHHGAILNEEMVRGIKERLQEERPGRVSREFGVNISTLYSIIRGKSWRHVTV
jgi:hypothetical protein